MTTPKPKLLDEVRPYSF